MKRNDLISHLSDVILTIQKDYPLLVGIDGVDASGKTTLANELAEALQASDRPIIRASIDGFHHPQSIRYKRGINSPEGYYRDSFNYPALIKHLLQPLCEGDLNYQTAVFDYETDSGVILPEETAEKDAILIMDGIFLLRPELVDYWDLKIFLDVDFGLTIQRALQRAAERGDVEDQDKIINSYNRRYIPGQKLYFLEANPKALADIVIDNRKFESPRITKTNA